MKDAKGHGSNRQGNLEGWLDGSWAGARGIATMSSRGNAGALSFRPTVGIRGHGGGAGSGGFTAGPISGPPRHGKGHRKR
jgi:hypothetical protein